MRRDAKLGKRVLLLDDGGNWRGGGTAWHMAEKGHKVTIVTPDPFVGREIVRTAADLPLRMRLAKLGATFITESAVTAWHGDGATIRNSAGWQRAHPALRHAGAGNGQPGGDRYRR